MVCKNSISRNSQDILEDCVNLAKRAESEKVGGGGGRVKGEKEKVQFSFRPHYYLKEKFFYMNG